MLTRRSLSLFLAAPLLYPAGAAHSQSLDELIAQGLFEEAAAMAATASPEEALEVARRIYREAYTNGQLARDFEYAIRGFTAAKQLADIGEPLYEQLTFWHGFAVFSAAVEAQAAQTLATAEIALPMFEEALGLFALVADYPATIDVDMSRLVRDTNTYIAIQNAVIRRAR